MTVLTQNVEDMLKRLETHSKSELNLIRALSEAIRQVDDAALRELRNLTLSHELRRESILSELHLLAGRLCQLPAKPVAALAAAENEQHRLGPHDTNPPVLEMGAQGANAHAEPRVRHAASPAQHASLQQATPTSSGFAHHAGVIHASATVSQCSARTGGDWRQAAQNIADDLDYAFAAAPRPRH